MPTTPTTAVKVELVGWRGHKGQYAAMSDEMVKFQRDNTKSYLNDVLRRAQELSPFSDRMHAAGTDPKKTKYSGDPHFRDEWRVSYQANATGAEGDVTNYSAHGNLVIFPTKAHAIIGHSSPHQLLAFEPAGSEVLFAHQVQHPGTKGNDIPSKIEHEFGTAAAQRRLQAAAVQAFQSSFYGYFTRYGK